MTLPSGARAGSPIVPASEPRAFLTGEWRYLAMLNYRVDSAILTPFVPRGTVLDTWQGAAYVSVVGFLFCDTRLLGVPIPFHRTFEEVNLRFYVRRETGSEVRRGVVFVKEIVPRRAIAIVARLVYNEPYVGLAMRHKIATGVADARPSAVTYSWRHRSRWAELSVESTGPATALTAGSEEEFITEHYWGYTRRRDGGTLEYHVAHPPWRLWRVTRASLTGDPRELYGDALGEVLSAAPHSAFLAEGSAITVGSPTRLP